MYCDLSRSVVRSLPTTIRGTSKESTLSFTTLKESPYLNSEFG